jgi:AAA+ ATPase superfamily predicted ATPase
MIGRKKEQEDLQRSVESKQSEFVAVFGRRRVGKTFLVREYFSNRFTFYHTGMANTEKHIHLSNFNSSLHKYGKIPYPEFLPGLNRSSNSFIYWKTSTRKVKRLYLSTKCPGWIRHERVLFKP